MVEFTYDQFIAAMETVVDRQGKNFVYAIPSNADGADGGFGECYYNPKNDPKGRDTGCIIGETFRELTGAYPDDSCEGKNALSLFLFDDDDRIVEAAAAAQSVQDGGSSWGMALRWAKSTQDYR